MMCSRHGLINDDLGKRGTRQRKQIMAFGFGPVTSLASLADWG